MAAEAGATYFDRKAGVEYVKRADGTWVPVQAQRGAQWFEIKANAGYRISSEYPAKAVIASGVVPAVAWPRILEINAKYSAPREAGTGLPSKGSVAILAAVVDGVETKLGTTDQPPPWNNRIYGQVNAAFLLAAGKAATIRFEGALVGGSGQRFTWDGRIGSYVRVAALPLV
ncbi:hypothetical protein ABT160_23560 [Streptomyces sp. NPDC001941]|uniref:hypothetical protein n=1 Tax=Streptomyces sp. NPDC001941 TaxID=3154659 RepID=UPI00331BC83D